MALATQTARTHFLEAAARRYAVKDPSTSAHLMLQRNVGTILPARSIGEDLTTPSCRACGTVLISGWTSRTSISNSILNEKKRSSKKGIGKDDRKRERSLMVECLTCRRYIKTPLGPSRKPKKRKYESVITTQAMDISKPPTTQSEMRKLAKGNAQSKQRAKARKGGLQALLAKSKQSSASSTRDGLDLMDFMKQE